MAAQAQYRTQHVATAPPGWKVRSKMSGEHVIVLAFPPGKRKRGSGKLLEILHPEGENPRRCNPGELLIFGNPAAKHGRANPKRGGKAKLTAAEDAFWTKAFSSYVNSGKSEAAADRLAWKETREQFPRLRAFSGARGNPRRTKKFYSDQRAGWRRALAEGRVVRMGPMTVKAFPTVEAAKKSGFPIERANPRQRNVISEEMDPGHPGEMRFAPWRRRALRFISSHWWGKTLSNAESAKIMRLAGAPPGEYDWSFIRDSEDAQVRAIFRYIKDRHSQPGPHRGFNPGRSNPRRKRRDRNPSETQQAVKLYQSFHGKDPKEISERQESAAMRLEYTCLGALDYILFRTPLGDDARLNFEGEGVKLASSPNGQQLYCIGGNQNILPLLDSASQEKDFIDLGDALEVQYVARKIHGKFEPVAYFHKFGEDTGSLPRLFFDKLKKRIFFTGGDYHIDASNGVSPGIVN